MLLAVAGFKQKGGMLLASQVLNRRGGGCCCQQYVLNRRREVLKLKLLYVHRNRRLIGDGEPRTAT